MSDAQIFEPEGRAIPFAEEGEGPALVLLPAQGLSIGYLELLAHSVAQEDFRVVRVGTRRVGAASGVSVSDLAQDVVDVLDHLGIDSAWIGGHAFGGSVARVAAAEHYDRVSGVVLFGVEGTEPATLADVPAELADPEATAVQAAAWQAPAPFTAALPVLVVQGTDDRITPPANGLALQASAPAFVSVVPIEGAGHMFPLTHMGAVSWAIEDYLDWD